MEAKTIAQHTQGLLVVKKDGVLVGGPVRELPRGPVQSQIASVCCVEDADQQANARRLAACWNACDGSKTEDLERLGADYIKPLIDLIDHRDEARQLLAKVLKTHDDNMAAMMRSGTVFVDADPTYEQIRTFLAGGAK